VKESLGTKDVPVGFIDYEHFVEEMQANPSQREKGNCKGSVEERCKCEVGQDLSVKSEKRLTKVKSNHGGEGETVGRIVDEKTEQDLSRGDVWCLITTDRKSRGNHYEKTEFTGICLKAKLDVSIQIRNAGGRYLS